MKVTIYPHSTSKGDIRVNPYISDFIQTLEQNGMIIANPPHKNPLFSLIPQKTDSDAYIFHWLENVPDYKYGVLQTLAAIWLLFKIKLHNKKSDMVPAQQTASHNEAPMVEKAIDRPPSPQSGFDSDPRHRRYKSCSGSIPESCSQNDILTSPHKEPDRRIYASTGRNRPVDLG